MTPVSAGLVSGHYAGAFTRGLAFIVDWIVILVLYSIFVAGAQVLAGFLFEVELDSGVQWLIGLGVWAVLYLALGTAITGRTIGKALLGLKIVTRAGLSIGLGRATARVFALPISIALLGLGFLGIVLGKEHRALHDVIAGTSVVYDWGDRRAEMPAPLTRWLQRRSIRVGSVDE